MAIGDDFSINSGGDIRHASGTTVYSVLELHAWLQDLADNAASSGDDVMSILQSNPSKLDGPRSAIKPMMLNLLGTVNIDDTAARFINFGSVSQDSGNELYTGLKSIGTPLVAGSPVYVVQNGAKLTKFWPDGHIQILVKGKTGGSLIDSGDVRVYSRKYGQTYADFAANLVAGGEQPAALSTELTSWTTLSKSEALALSGNVSITVADQYYDNGDGNGSKLYNGTITLSGGISVADAAQYLQAICDESSTTTINGELGWKYRALSSYTPNAKAPFGHIAGGKWFVAQGWYIAGALAGDGPYYEMVSADGTPISNPTSVQIQISSLPTGARVLVARDDGAGYIVDNEYTLASATTSGGNTCVVNEVIKVDTPDTGYIRVGGIPYEYTAVNRGTKTFTISGTWGQVFPISTEAFCPFIDGTASSSTMQSPSFIRSASFTARVFARKGSSPSYQPANATFTVDSGTASYGVIMPSDE